MIGRLVLAAALLLATPAAALACPVCGLGTESDNAWAYGAMSVVLSAVPLGIIGGIVFWIRRASR